MIRFLFVCILAGLVVPAAADPVIVVPPASEPIALAMPGPIGTLPPAPALVEREGAPIVTQWVPRLAPDGTVDTLSGLLAAVLPKGDGKTPRQFAMKKAEKQASSFAFKDVSDRSLGLWDGDRPVLVYNHGDITNENVPKNDSRRTRGCFIHPVYGLDGEVLTDSFPKDHYHHHGIFWAWPHVQIEGKEYDLWMYNNIQQRFVRWLGRETGPVAAVLGVENGWFVGDRKVMIERVWVRVYKVAGDARAIDFDLVLIPVERPVTLLGAPGKSYGGLNMRFAPRKESETVITVPEGRTKEDLPDTRLAWADLSAPFGGKGVSGAAIFVHPSHPDYVPTWLTRHYGVLCVGWPGVRPKTFQPNEPIRLSYRIWIHKEVDHARLINVATAYQAGLAAEWQ